MSNQVLLVDSNAADNSSLVSNEPPVANHEEIKYDSYANPNNPSSGFKLLNQKKTVVFEDIDTQSESTVVKSDEKEPANSSNTHKPVILARNSSFEYLSTPQSTE